jgi:hypothetical protein
VLITAAGSVLLLVDMQQRLLPAIHDGDAVLANAVRLATAAGLLDVPVCATEQNPAGLGPTVEPLAGFPQLVLPKTSFGAAAGIDRAQRHGAEVVTTEMVLFEWLRDSTHPRFRDVHRLIR